MKGECEFGGCSWCHGEEYCDFHKTRCAVCGEKFATGEMWNLNGKKLCFSCFNKQKGAVTKWQNPLNARAVMQR
ncbi:MAG: hypothetical protein LUD72_06975 [Bacteroidales bacterium]|nr:hypothetical protein [Bacteroidales bacterium]